PIFVGDARGAGAVAATQVRTGVLRLAERITDSPRNSILALPAQLAGGAVIAPQSSIEPSLGVNRRIASGTAAGHPKRVRQSASARRSGSSSCSKCRQ